MMIKRLQQWLPSLVVMSTSQARFVHVVHFKVSSENLPSTCFLLPCQRSILECPQRSIAQRTFVRDLFSLAGVGGDTREQIH